ncbi:hypothetical protein LUZ60_009221 [Juncus effusus]|nr:hypothetical protein LUZ60_009221 [Juncus effusus]
MEPSFGVHVCNPIDQWMRKINEQEIDRLRQEIDQQKQEASRREEEIIQREKIEKELLSTPDYLKLRHEHALRSNFTVEEINQATRNFSDSLILGKGAYGTVYKGYLGGTNVAIKILNPECTQGVLGFKQEVAILTTCRHPNLVTLMGVCYESSALIYELLPNGSLEDHLSGENNTTPLTWQVRTRIMCEICIALNFLHSNKPNMIIHGDLKPDNILLDANFTSKLSDFGISRIIERSNTNTTLHYSTCNPVGTYLYIDPEFAYSGKLTEKSDVFSFGVIILRLRTGKSVQGIVSGVEEAMEDGKLDKMIDVSAGEWPFDQAQELAVLGLRCAQIRRIDRPNLFKEVWPILESLQRNI